MKLSSLPVFAPCGVSSFFEIRDRDENGRPVKDPMLIGSRGGGFRISSGDYCIVELAKDAENDEVYLNGRRSDAPVTREVVSLMRGRFGLERKVRVHHKILAPIGAGFGTSGAGAIATAISIANLFGVHSTLEELGRLAHQAEIKCLTGLGTVTGLLGATGAAGLLVKEGAPGIGRVETIFDDYDRYRLITATFGAIEKSSIIRSETHRRKVNAWGRKTMADIQRDPSMESLLRYSRVFAEQIGLASKELLDVADYMVSCGAIGATQNMIGNAVHSLVARERVPLFVKLVSKRVDRHAILVSELDASGPRFVSPSEYHHATK